MALVPWENHPVDLALRPGEEHDFGGPSVFFPAAQNIIRAGHQAGRLAYRFFYPSPSRRPSAPSRMPLWSDHPSSRSLVPYRNTYLQAENAYRKGGNLQLARYRARRTKHGKEYPGSTSRFPAKFMSGGKELKFYDKFISVDIDSTVAVVTGPLNDCPIGNASNNRVGSKWLMKSIRMNGVIKAKTLAADMVSTTFRLMLVYDRSPNGAAALPSPNNDIMNSSTVLALPSMDNKGRFVILRDELLTTKIEFRDAGTQGGFVNIPIKWYLKCALPVYNTNTTDSPTIAQYEVGSLLLYTDIEVAGAATDLTFNGELRIRLQD